MWDDDQALSHWVDLVEERWREGGMDSSTRRRLAAEIQTDLAGAREAGVPVGDLVSRDPVRFAQEVAEAEGVELAPVVMTRPTARGVVTASLLGALGGLWRCGSC